jgi:phosphate starvation-inducible protein PhoH and related proteins
MGKKLKFSDNGHLSNGNGRLHDGLFEVKQRKLYSYPRPKTDNQLVYMEAIDSNDIVFCTGPAGSGKTHLAVGMAVEALKDGDVKKIVAIRPCIGVGKTMGFLPGKIENKVAPYLRPIMDELMKFFTPEEIRRLRANDILEMGSLEHIRGRTIEDAFVILDEAQNCTEKEMKAFLTRLGFGSKFVLNGDISRGRDGQYEQCDLPVRERGAFEAECNNLGDIEGIAVVKLTKLDIVRHPLVQKMQERWNGEISSAGG